MKGLLLSQYFSFRTKSVIVHIGCLAALAVWNFIFGIYSTNNVGVFLILYFFVTVLSGGVMGFGETYKWNSYLAALPVSRRVILLSQYIETAVYEICIYGVMLFSELLRIFCNRGDMDEMLGVISIIASCIVMISIGTLLASAFGFRAGQRIGAIVNALSSILVMFLACITIPELIAAEIAAAFFVRAATVFLAIKVYARRDL